MTVAAISPTWIVVGAILRVPDLPPDGGVAVRAGLEEQCGVVIERAWFVEGWRSLWRRFRGGTHVPRFP